MNVKYSHLSHSHRGWNESGGGEKVAKSLNMVDGINVEGVIFWKKLVYKCKCQKLEFPRVV